MLQTSNVIPVSLPQLAFIINQQGYKEVLICGLRQSGRTSMTRLLADLLRYSNPLWEAVAPEEPGEVRSRETSEPLAVKQGPLMEALPKIAELPLSDMHVRQADLMEARLPCPDGQLRVMLHTSREYTDVKNGPSFVFVTINGLRYYAVAVFNGEGDVPSYTLNGAPGAFESDRVSDELYKKSSKDDVDTLLQTIHESFRMRSQIIRFSQMRTGGEDALVTLLAEELPQAYADHMLTTNTLAPEYQALLRRKPEPIHFTRTGPGTKEANDFAVLLTDISQVKIIQQPKLDDCYVIASVKMTKINDHGAYLRYVHRDNPKDELIHHFISGESESAVYRVAHWASLHLSVMFEVPRKLFGQDVLTIGSL